jgi:hypothetical protein
MGIPDERLIDALSNDSNDTQHLAQLNARAMRKAGHDVTGVIMTITEQPAPQTDNDNEQETPTPA